MDVKLDFELNEFHHIFTLMEGGLDIFKREEKKEVKRLEGKKEVPRPVLEGEIYEPPIDIVQPVRLKEKKSDAPLSA